MGRITTSGHQGQKVFLDDVISTYNRIRTRATEIATERAANAATHEVEQIQLQAVEPGTVINFNVPAANSTEPIEQQARAIFETFPPGLQRALESGSLDRVNEVLAKMSVEEAEEIVGQLGDSGMLDMRSGVIDSTTEEGQQELRKMKEEREKKDPGLGGGEPGEDTEEEDDVVRRTEDVQIADPD